MTSKHYKITIKRRSYDVEVGDLSSSPVKVVVDGVQYDVEVPADALIVGHGPAADAPPPSAPKPRADVPSHAPAAPAPTPAAPIAQPTPTPTQPQPAKPTTPLRPATSAAGTADPGVVRALMPGRVLKVNVAAGANVSRGQALVVLESMKMEQTIAAPKEGKVKGVYVSAGDTVTRGQTLVELE